MAMLRPRVGEGPPEVVLVHGGAQNAHCSNVEAELSDSGVGHISCTLKGHSALDGKDLILRRSAEGIWSCDGSAFEARYRPTGC